MNKKIIVFITASIIVILIIALVVFFLKNNENAKRDKNASYVVGNLNELFPSSKVKQTFEDSHQKYEVNVKSVDIKNGVTTVTSQYETTTDNVATTVETTYKITSDKVIQSAKYISRGLVVSVIYPTEIIVGVPYVNMTWKSVDGLITNKVVSMKNNRVIIESVRKTNIYQEGKKDPISKEFKETRVYEKGKGIVLYRTEVVGDKTTIYEKKLVK